MKRLKAQDIEHAMENIYEARKRILFRYSWESALSTGAYDTSRFIREAMYASAKKKIKEISYENSSPFSVLFTGITLRDELRMYKELFATLLEPVYFSCGFSALELEIDDVKHVLHMCADAEVQDRILEKMKAQNKEWANIFNYYVKEAAPDPELKRAIFSIALVLLGKIDAHGKIESAKFSEAVDLHNKYLAEVISFHSAKDEMCFRGNGVASRRPPRKLSDAERKGLRIVK